jgi:hypothetical protein
MFHSAPSLSQQLGEIYGHHGPLSRPTNDQPSTEPKIFASVSALTDLSTDDNAVAADDGTRTPQSTTHHSLGFQPIDTESLAASVTLPRDSPAAAAPSVTSVPEVVDVEDITDIDMLSEEGDGVATPTDSWSQVDEREALEEEEEDEEFLQRRNQLVGA